MAPLLDNLGLGGAIDRVTGDARAGGAEKFKKTLTESNFGSGTKALTPGENQKIGTFTVGAQEQYRWGQGTAEHPDNQGYLYIELKDNANPPVEITGTTRLEQRDAQERNIITVHEEEEEVLHGDLNDRKLKQALPEQVSFPKVGRDSKLTLSVNPDSPLTLDYSNCTVLAPVTVYPV